jgi:hypothetical protein
MAATDELDFPVLDHAKWYAIVSAGTIALRFGPFSGPEIGKIMTQCVEEKIPLFVTADCGAEFDWTSARAMRETVVEIAAEKRGADADKG